MKRLLSVCTIVALLALFPLLGVSTTASASASQCPPYGGGGVTTNPACIWSGTGYTVWFEYWDGYSQGQWISLSNTPFYDAVGSAINNRGAPLYLSCSDVGTTDCGHLVIPALSADSDLCSPPAPLDPNGQPWCSSIKQIYLVP